jgi:hypothetical protein
MTPVAQAWMAEATQALQLCEASTPFCFNNGLAFI